MSDCGQVQKVFVPVGGLNSEPVPSPAPIKGIQITDMAADKIRLFVEKDGKSVAEMGLRVAVVKEGCSGFSYVMDIAPVAKAQEDQDKIFTAANGATVMIKKDSYFYLTGSILDYTEALTGSGFVLNNPNIKKSCSCGSSFNV